MPRQFLLQPPRPRLRVAALVSLVLHTALALPLVLPRSATEVAADPIDQMVVFLVPPEPPVGRDNGERGVKWVPVAGNEGAIAPAPARPPAPELELAEGKAGEATPFAEPDVALEAVPEESALSQIEVDSMVERDPTSAAPTYPPNMLARNVQGSTFVHYVVDTTGRVDSTTIRVVRTTHPDFARAVRDALVLMKFRPAVQASRKVRQWVEQNFAFKIVPRARADTT